MASVAIIQSLGDRVALKLNLARETLCPAIALLLADREDFLTIADS